MTLTGSLRVSGSITASQYHIENVTRLMSVAQHSLVILMMIGMLEPVACVVKADGTKILDADNTTETVKLECFRVILRSS